MKLFSYIRFSTHTQADGDSLRRQTQAARDYADKHGYEYVDQSFRDLGVSGFKSVQRPALDELMGCIEQGVIQAGDAVFIENVDRLSRQGFRPTYNVICNMLESDVTLIAAAERLILTRDSMNDLVSVIRIATSASLAYDESKKKSERVQAAKNKQRQDAINGKPINRRLPYWLVRTDDGYAIDPVKSEPIKLLISMRQQGHGLAKIAAELNRRGYPTRFNRSGWSFSTLAGILQNRALYGAYQPGTRITHSWYEPDPTTIITGYYPALITFTEWQDLQCLFTGAGGPSPTVDNPLSRLVRCGYCNTAMFLKVSKRRSAKTGEMLHYWTWICTLNKNGGCELTPVKDLHRAVYAGIKHLKISDTKTDQSRLAQIDADLNQTRHRLDEIRQALTTGTGSVVVLATAAADLEQKLKDLINEQDRIQTTTTEQVNMIAGLDPVTDGVEFNINARKLIKSVKVYQFEDQAKFPTKRYYRAVIEQQNGYNVIVTASRVNQYADWTYRVADGEWLAGLTAGHEYDLDYDADMPDVADEVDELDEVPFQ